MGFRPLALLWLVGALHSASQYTDGEAKSLPKAGNSFSGICERAGLCRWVRRYRRPEVHQAGPGQDLDSLWEEISRRLRASVPDSTFKLWLEPLRVVGAAGETLYLSAPENVQSWVERRYSKLIVEALETSESSLRTVSFAPGEHCQAAGGKDELEL